MREPGDAPGFRFAAIEHERPGAFKGRIILAAYTDDGQMLAWIAATPTTLRTAKAFAKDGQGVPRSSFPELTGYDDANVVWTVGRSHAWIDGWGPLLYEALLAFVVAQGYSGWVTSDTSATSKAARAVWRRFSERDDVEFRHDVGKNVNGESVDAMRALPNLLERRFPLLEQADKSTYPWRIKQLLDRGRIAEDGRFSVEGLVDVDEARANPRFTDIPNVVAVVDTADVHSYDDAYVFGRAATFDDELGVVGWHVTDDPDVVLDKIERGIDFKKAYGSKGQTSELGPGLYVSAVPHFWAARSTKKWAFVGTLGPEQRQAVLAALRAEIESDARRGRITEREAATAFRYLDTAEQTDDLRPLTILASLPYSIAWHKPAWLEDVGVVGAHPQAVKVALSGKFARLEHSYPSPDTLRALRRAGFAGAFTTGGAGANPELVVFHGASVTPLGIEDVE